MFRIRRRVSASRVCGAIAAAAAGAFAVLESMAEVFLFMAEKVVSQLVNQLCFPALSNYVFLLRATMFSCFCGVLLRGGRARKNLRVGRSAIVVPKPFM
jgi:hypothetical protein